jgi:hypothetical protein
MLVLAARVYLCKVARRRSNGALVLVFLRDGDFVP